ncbi:MAG: SIMPL domain-containing protein [Sinobacteraceae bacterium]|nr:SIMPL domain-containing protein [Nevskiaceae bacterium]MBV8853868.1 SIMPL domain-containing protein [Nevskiaceae bacterium]MBV9914821.1 SIMPL domain-containing protein [Nevskiaceae bacterium]
MKTLCAVCLLAMTGVVAAQQVSPGLSSIRVMGESVVTVKPQRALVNVGVLTQQRQSQAAVTDNARTSEAVTNALHKLLGDQADISTVNYAVNPEYQYRSGNGRPSVSGYTAVNVMRVTVDNLDQVGAVIDTAVQAGANHIESVQYSVRDPAPYRAQALREAAAKARADAETLATALNVHILRLLKVEQLRDPGLPPPVDPSDPENRLSPGGDPLPVQPPGFDFTANVALTLEVSTR